MKVSIYAVYDVASGVYDGPFPGVADGAVIRDFTDMCKKGDSKMGQHPEDFTLFKVGTWNDGTGEVEAVVPVKLFNGLEVIVNMGLMWSWLAALCVVVGVPTIMFVCLTVVLMI